MDIQSIAVYMVVGMAAAAFVVRIVRALRRKAPPTCQGCAAHNDCQHRENDESRR